MSDSEGKFDDTQPPDEQIARQAKVAVRSVLAGRIGYQFLTIGFTLVLARLLTPVDYGVYGIAFVAMQFLIYVEGFRFESALIQRSDLTLAEEKQGYSLLLMFGFVFAVGLFILGGSVASVFDEPAAKGVIRLLSLAFVVRALGSAQRVRLRRELRFGVLAVIEIAGLVPGGFLAVWLAMNGYGATALAAFYLMQSLGAVLVATVIVGIIVPAWPKAAFARSLARFGVPATGSEVVSYLWYHAPSIIVGYGLGTLSLGLFRQATALVSKPVVYLQEVTHQLAFPVLSRAHEKGYEVKGMYLHAFHTVCLIAIPICVFTIILAPELVWILYGPQWGGVVPLVRILVPVAFAKVIHPFAAGLFQARGRPSVDLKINAILLVLLFGLLAAGMQFGTAGVAAGTAVSFGVLAIVAQIVANRWLDVSLPEIASTMLTGIGASLLSGGLAFSVKVLFVPDEAYIKGVLVAGAIGIVTYGLCIRILDRRSWDEVLSILNPFQRNRTAS